MKRFIIITVGMYCIVLASFVCIFSMGSEDKIKNTEANDIVFTIQNYWHDIDYAINIIKEYQYPIDYIVLGVDGEKIGASKEDLVTDYRYNYIHKDYSVDLIKDGKLQGKIIFINHEDDELKIKMKRWALSFLFFFLLKDVIIFLYLKKRIFVPVQKMNQFARQIAKGNLDISMGTMNRNSFGNFSETFEMMREELVYAKKKEREADKLRREVITSISHDIKNPVASIQAVAEYQAITTQSEELRQEFQIIIEKTNQINGMILNLRTSMLNELERLTIHLETAESTVIEKALRQADFKKKVEDFVVPECLVALDKVRIFQIMDNIFANSYKYANTKIEVRSYFEKDYLCVCIKDFGQGVKKEEEIFLTQKYFRGENAKEKEGAGLGMYIVQYLMNEMNGKVCCSSKEGEGFEVKLWFELAT